MSTQAMQRNSSVVVFNVQFPFVAYEPRFSRVRLLDKAGAS